LWFYNSNSTTSSSTTAAPTTPHPIKDKFSSSKNRLLFTFAAPGTRGLRHEKSSCISLNSKNCESPSSWRSLSNTCQFSLQSHEARLYVRATKLHKKYRVFILHTTSSLQYANAIFLRETKYFTIIHIFCRSRQIHQSHQRAKLLRVVQLESMPGYKNPNIDSGATPIGSAGRTPDRKIILR
jgi:hypothetical protein